MISSSSAKIPKVCTPVSAAFLKRGTRDEVAIQEMINTYKGVERCVRYAYELTKKRNKENTLTLCDKANVLTYAHDLWRRVFDEVGEDYPDIKKEYAFVDATTMWMVKNPEWFDVVVTLQHVWRHHHRPRRDDSGGYGCRSLWQSEPGECRYV